MIAKTAIQFSEVLRRTGDVKSTPAASGLRAWSRGQQHRIRHILLTDALLMMALPGVMCGTAALRCKIFRQMPLQLLEDDTDVCGSPSGGIFETGA